MMASRLGLGGLALNFKVTAKQNRSNLSVCGEDRGGGGGGGWEPVFSKNNTS